MKCMQNDKSPVNEALTKEFNDIFWNELKDAFLDSVLETKDKGHLNTSQKQAIRQIQES